MVTYLPSGLEPILQGLQNVAGAGGAAVSKDRRRLESIQDNPQLIAQLAPVVRRAQEAGQLDALSRSLNIPVGTLSTMAAGFQATPQEQIEQGFVEGGGVEATVENRLTGLQMETLQNLYTTEDLEARQAVDLPQLNAETARMENLAAQANAAFGSRLFNARLEEGIPEITADLEAVKAAFESREINVRDEALTQYVDMVNDPTTDPHIREMAATTLSNQALAQHMQFHEGLEFQERLAAAQQRGSPADRLSPFLKLRDARNDAIDRVRAANESGDEGLMRAAQRDLNTLNDMGAELATMGLIPALPSTGGEEERGRIFGGLKRIELVESLPFHASVKAALKDIEESGATAEEIQETMSVLQERNPEMANQFRSGLSQLEINPSRTAPGTDTVETQDGRSAPARPKIPVMLPTGQLNPVILQNLSERSRNALGIKERQEKFGPIL